MKRLLASRSGRIAFGVLTVLLMVTGTIVATSRWLGLPPYSGSAEGVVVSKGLVVLQGRGTRVEYFVTLRSADGTIARVAVSSDMYQKISKGWMVRQDHSVVTATSPDGTRLELSATAY